MSNNDLTFITNENGQSLLNRFNTLIKGTKFFDCLVGYFYSSGFHAMYKSLESTEKIRILIGISTDKGTFDIIQESKEVQQKLAQSHKEAKDELSKQIVQEMEESKDSLDVEEGVKKFIAWLISGKLQIKVYPADKILHGRNVYLMKEREINRWRSTLLILTLWRLSDEF